MDQSGYPIGRVVGAGCVQQESRSTRGCVVVSVVEQKRSSANARVEAASGNALERRPANCCVRSAGGEGIKRIAPFRRGEVGIAPVRRRVHGSRGPRSSETDEREQPKCGVDRIGDCFHCDWIFYLVWLVFLRVVTSFHFGKTTKQIETDHGTGIFFGVVASASSRAVGRCSNDCSTAFSAQAR